MSSALIPGMILSFVMGATVRRSTGSAAPPPELDSFALLGFMLAVIQLACFAQQHHSTALVFGLGLCAAAMAGYAVLQGAWPLGMIQLVWSVAAFRRWARQVRGAKSLRRDSAGAALFWPIASRTTRVNLQIDTQSRVTRMFGPL